MASRPSGEFDLLVNVLSGPPALVVAGEVVAEILVEELEQSAGPRVDLHAVVSVFDRPVADLEVGGVRRCDLEEGVAHRRHRACEPAHRRDWPRSTPAAATVEEAVENADRRRAAARLGLLDDHLALPGERVDHQHLLDAGRLERLLRLEVTKVEDALRSLRAERRRQACWRRGQAGHAPPSPPCRQSPPCGSIAPA